MTPIAYPISVRLKVVRFAVAKVGARYVFGAAGPDAWDCSGLVAQAWMQGAGHYMPHNAAMQYRDRMIVTFPGGTLRRGDLVFYYGPEPEHVSMFIGHNRAGRRIVVAATDEAHGVEVVTIDAYAPPYAFGRPLPHGSSRPASS